MTNDSLLCIITKTNIFQHLLFLLLSIDLRQRHGALRHENPHNGPLIGILGDLDLLFARWVLWRRGHLLNRGAIEGLHAPGWRDELDLVGQRLGAEGHEALGHAIGHDHAQGAKDEVHGLVAFVRLVDGIVHALFDDGVTEGNVLLLGHSVEVEVVLRVLGQLEA